MAWIVRILTFLQPVTPLNIHDERRRPRERAKVHAGFLPRGNWQHPLLCLRRRWWRCLILLCAVITAACLHPTLQDVWQDILLYFLSLVHLLPWCFFSALPDLFFLSLSCSTCSTSLLLAVEGAAMTGAESVHIGGGGGTGIFFLVHQLDVAVARVFK